MSSNESIEQERNSIAKILAEARRSLLRVTPEMLSGERENGTLIVDIRPVEQRQRDGDLPGAIVIDRNVLEWRLDPSSEHRIPQVTGYDIRIVVVCNEGYSSSLAAAVLQKLGLHQAVDINVPIGCGDVAVWPGDVMVGDREGVFVIPAHLADEVADEAVEMTAFEDFVTDMVQNHERNILGLYPATDPKTKEEFALWRAARNR